MFPNLKKNKKLIDKDRFRRLVAIAVLPDGEVARRLESHDAMADQALYAQQDLKESINTLRKLNSTPALRKLIIPFIEMDFRIREVSIASILDIPATYDDSEWHVRLLVVTDSELPKSQGINSRSQLPYPLLIAIKADSENRTSLVAQINCPGFDLALEISIRTLRYLIHDILLDVAMYLSMKLGDGWTKVTTSKADYIQNKKLEAPFYSNSTISPEYGCLASCFRRVDGGFDYSGYADQWLDFSSNMPKISSINTEFKSIVEQLGTFQNCLNVIRALLRFLVMTQIALLRNFLIRS